LNYEGKITKLSKIERPLYFESENDITNSVYYNHPLLSVATTILQRARSLSQLM
jgi:hypothetical protein